MKNLEGIAYEYGGMFFISEYDWGELTEEEKKEAREKNFHVRSTECWCMPEQDSRGFWVHYDVRQ